MLGGNDIARKATHFLECVAFQARHEVRRCYWSAVITFGGFPEHWILYYQVYKLIKWLFARFYSIKTKAMRGINRKIQQ